MVRRTEKFIKQAKNPRVVSGKYKGRKIIIPYGIRPTTSRVKRAIFDNITGYIKDTIVLDVFAGSGNIGIEALSRGARKVVFIEQDKFVVQTLRSNLDKLEIPEEQYKIVVKGYEDFVKRNKDKNFELIFADPPFELITEFKIHLFKKILSPEGLIVLKIPTSSKIDIPNSMGVMRKKKYGVNTVYFIMNK